MREEEERELNSLEGEIRKGLSLLSMVPSRINTEGERMRLLYALFCIAQIRLHKQEIEAMVKSMEPLMEALEAGDTISSIKALMSLEDKTEVPATFRSLVRSYESSELDYEGGLPLWGEAGPIEALAYHAGASVGMVESSEVATYGSLSLAYSWMKRLLV